MRFQLEVEPRIITETQDIVAFYDNQEEGAGQRFLTALDSHLLMIADKPKFPIKYSNVRCLKIKKYPYLIHYTVDERKKKVYVMAILHTSLNPAKQGIGR